MVEVTGQSAGGGSLLPPSGLQGPNSGRQAWWPALYPRRHLTSLQLFFFFLNVFLFFLTYILYTEVS